MNPSACLPCRLASTCKKSGLAWASLLLRNYHMHTSSEECRCVCCSFSMQSGLHDQLSPGRPSSMLDPAFGCASIIFHISQCLLTRTPMGADENMKGWQKYKEGLPLKALLGRSGIASIGFWYCSLHCAAWPYLAHSHQLLLPCITCVIG